MEEKKEENEKTNFETEQENQETTDIIEEIINDKTEEPVVEVTTIISETKRDYSDESSFENNKSEQTDGSQNINFERYMQNQQMNQSNSMGIAGFVLSIVAIIFSWIPVLNWILWLLGLIFSIIGMNRKPKGFAVAGLVISLLGLIVMIFLLAVIAAVFATSTV